jgi:hypothetical protein
MREYLNVTQNLLNHTQFNFNPTQKDWLSPKILLKKSLIYRFSLIKTHKFTQNHTKVKNIYFFY